LARDITERKQMERALHEYSERLEEMVAERTRALEDAQEQLVRQEKLTVLGQLAGGLAHELRTPLNTIKNAAYFLKMVVADPDPDTIEMLDMLDNSVTNSDRIITSLLNFARPHIPTYRTVNLAELIQKSLSQLTIPAQIKVGTDFKAVPQEIVADPNHLEVVFTNLIHNALQAMPDGGDLTIQIYSGDAGTVSVAIRDTGVGILPENRAMLFEPLFSTKTRGIGLGLAISKMLVKGHQGAIEVDSEPGVGSAFTVQLPINSKPDYQRS